MSSECPVGAGAEYATRMAYPPGGYPNAAGRTQFRGSVYGMLLLVVLVAAGALAAGAGWYALARWPSLDPGAPGGAVRAVGEQVREHEEAQPGFVRHRLAPAPRTGLALTLAVAVVAVGGAILAALAFLTRSNRTTLRIDRSVTNWAGTNATDVSTAVLKAVTQLGSSVVVITLSIVLVVVVAVTTRASRRRT